LFSHIRKLHCIRPYLDFKTASTVATLFTQILSSFVTRQFHIPDDSPPSPYVILSFSPSPVLLSVTPSLILQNSKLTCFINLFRLSLLPTGLTSWILDLAQIGFIYFFSFYFR